MNKDCEGNNSNGGNNSNNGNGKSKDISFSGNIFEMPDNIGSNSFYKEINERFSLDYNKSEINNIKNDSNKSNFVGYTKNNNNGKINGNIINNINIEGKNFLII